MVGRNRAHALVTAAEPATGQVVIGKLTALTADALTRRLVSLLRRQPHPVRSLTMDNGPEMSGWRRLQAALDAPCYFTDPYCAWQRGTNENTNGVIRQYFPKGTSLKTVTQRDCDAVADLLNTRPRKRLGGFTPEELLCALSVAVQTCYLSSYRDVQQSRTLLHLQPGSGALLRASRS